MNIDLFALLPYILLLIILVLFLLRLFFLKKSNIKSLSISDESIKKILLWFEVLNVSIHKKINIITVTVDFSSKELTNTDSGIIEELLTKNIESMLSSNKDSLDNYNYKITHLDVLKLDLTIVLKDWVYEKLMENYEY